MRRDLKAEIEMRAADEQQRFHKKLEWSQLHTEVLAGLGEEVQMIPESQGVSEVQNVPKVQEAQEAQEVQEAQEAQIQDIPEAQEDQEARWPREFRKAQEEEVNPEFTSRIREILRAEPDWRYDDPEKTTYDMYAGIDDDPVQGSSYGFIFNEY